MIIANGTALLFEDIDLTESKVITEGADKKYILQGICMQSNVKNRNGRIYPENVMDTEVNRYIKSHLLTGRSVGELNHPKGSDHSINYDRVSHKFTSLTKSGTDWIFEAQVANTTPIGSIVSGLMDIGVTMGISSRALGSVKLDGRGTKIVQNDFKLITPGDIVADPSAPDAFMTAVMEGHEWIFVNGALTECAVEDIQNTLNTLTRKNQLNSDNILNMFEWVLNNKIGVNHES